MNATKTRNNTPGATETMLTQPSSPSERYSYGEALQARQSATQRLREAEQEIRRWREAALTANARARRVEQERDRLETELRKITPPGTAAALVLAEFGASTASSADCTGERPARVERPVDVLSREVDAFHAGGLRRRGLSQ